MGNQTNAVDNKALSVKVITKNAEGERTITAVVSSNSLDRDYERVDVNSLRLPLKGGGYVVAAQLTGNEKVDIPMLLNHSFDVEDVIGSVRKAYLNDMGELVVDFGISSRAKAQDLMTLIDEGHLDNAFSITMSDYQYEDSTIYNAEIIEISLVFKGSNKDARLLAVKSLLKESKMTEVVEQTPEAEEVVTEEVVETPEVETPEVEVTEVEAPEVEETEVEEAEVVEEVETPVSETKSIKKETKEMSVEKDIAVKQVKDVPVVEVVETIEKTMTKNEARAKMAQHLSAVFSKDEKAAKAISAELAKTKVINGTSGEVLFAPEILSLDILDTYEQIGRVGQLVTRIDIEGAETYRELIEVAGVGFQEVALGGTKDQDQPVWNPVVYTPYEWAVIVAWLDGVAKRSPLAVYNQLVRYIAKEYVKLEDRIILSYAGATVDGETRPATGLVPLLNTANRDIAVASYESGDVVTALGEAYGDVDTDGTLTLVSSRKTWGRLATSIDAEGRPLFTVVGSQVSAGALGTFNVVISQEIDDDNVVIGHFPDYRIVTRGGLATLFSREATIGSGEDTLNLFTSDASAIRADVDITGGAARLESFVLLTFPSVS